MAIVLWTTNDGKWQARRFNGSDSIYCQTPPKKCLVKIIPVRSEGAPGFHLEVGLSPSAGDRAAREYAIRIAGSPDRVGRSRIGGGMWQPFYIVRIGSSDMERVAGEIARFLSEWDGALTEQDLRWTTKFTVNWDRFDDPERTKEEAATLGNAIRQRLE